MIGSVVTPYSGSIRGSRRLFFMFISCAVAVCGAEHVAAAADLFCSSPTTISTATTYDNVTVQSGCILTVDAVLTVNNNMTIQSGGVVTHSTRLLAGLVLNVTGSLDVQAGGSINLNGKGLLGGYSGTTGIHGETFDSSGTTIVPGAAGNDSGCNSANRSGAGASYGGVGGDGGCSRSSNAPYDLLEEPQHLGSGGGGVQPTKPGGNGGGRLTVTAGSLIVNGMVSADGGDGVGTSGSGITSGAGSGGAIRMSVGTLSGSGSIQAIGGNGTPNCCTAPGGSGGGGRIAIFYNALGLPTPTNRANGAGSGAPASAGTIYLKDNAQASGDLIIDNGTTVSGLNTPLKTSLTAFRRVTIQSQGRLSVLNTDVPSFSVEQPVSTTGNGALTLSGGVTLGLPKMSLSGGSSLTLGNGDSLTLSNTSGFDLEVLSGSAATFGAGSVFNADTLRVNGGTLNTSISLTFPTGAEFELSGGGTLNILKETFSLGVFNTTNVQPAAVGQVTTVNLASSGRLAMSSGSATIGNRVALVKDGAFGTSGTPDQIGSLTVESGGVVTHSTRLLAGLVLNVTGSLDVQAGGSINLNGKGLLGGYSGTTGIHGETFDSSGTTIVPGAAGNDSGCNSANRSGAGASYGGVGGDGGCSRSSNAPYDLLEEPQHLGSGGGGVQPTKPGGNGGGRLTVTAGSLIVNGMVSADGGDGVGTSGSGITSGAGSGGAIRMSVGTLSGSGSIQAIGGNGTPNCCTAPGGSGGGGRIAIYYSSNTLAQANLSARGGGLGNNASAGTIYLNDNAQTYGDLIIDNGGVASGLSTPLKTALVGFRNVNIRNQGQVTSMSQRDLSGISLQLSGALRIGGTGRLSLDAGGLLGGGMTDNTFGNAGESYDPLGLTIVSGSTGGAGGSYGGFGGGAGANPLYGNPNDPQHVGSGGSRSTTSGLGGAGGGRLSVVASLCDIASGGSITANGGSATTGTGTQGGGSGGSIKLVCGNATGSGAITANGGAGAGTNGNGGGGGRIVIVSDANAFTGTVQVIGGGATGAGAPGLQGTLGIAGISLIPTMGSVAPPSGGNAGTLTLTILGANLDPMADVRLTMSGRSAITAVSVAGVPARTSLVATFDLRQKAIGTWEVVVENPDGVIATPPRMFEIIEGGETGFFALMRDEEMRICVEAVAQGLVGVESALVDPGGCTLVPIPVRPFRNYSDELIYGNNGTVDVPAPLLIVTATSNAALRVSSLEPYSQDPMQVIALGPPGAEGVIPAGSRYNLPIYFRSAETGPHNRFELVLSEMPADDAPIDWAAMEAQMRPDDLPDDAWDATWANVQEQVGQTRADLHAAMLADAIYLAGLGRRTYSVRDLFNFEMVRARNGHAPTSTLEDTTDLVVSAPGLPIVFSRTYPVSLERRFQVGPLGRGWTHSYQIYLAQPETGKVEVRGPGDQRRGFVASKTTWVSNVGDPGVLTRRVDNGWLLKEKDGRTWAFSSTGALEYLEDSNLNRLTFTYTSGALTRIEHSSGPYMDLTCSGGRITAITDQVGRQVQYAYAGGGDHLTMVTEYGNRDTVYAYTPSTGGPADHALTTITYPDLTKRLFEYDTRGWLTAQSQAGGVGRLTYTYVAPGEVQAETLTGDTYVYHVGYEGEILKFTDPQGHPTTFSYGENGATSGTTGPGGTTTHYSYDSMMNVREIRDALGYSVVFGWTPDLSRLDWMRDQRGNVTDYKTDAHGNTTEIKYPDPLLPPRTATYDTVGNVTSTKSRRNQTITFTHDIATGRVLTKSYPGGRVSTYTYDGHGNLLTASDTQTGKITMQYDTPDFLTRIDYPGGRWFTFAYDDAGKRTQRAGHDGFVLNYQYDTAGRLSGLTDGSATPIVSYQYDVAGRLSREDKGNGTYTTYTYDTAGQVTSIIHYSPTNTIQARYDYTYDTSGRRTSMTTLTETTNYSYDLIGQLTGFGYPGRDVTYSYDPAGNRTSVVDNLVETLYTPANPMNQYGQVGATTYHHDDDGNLDMKTDASGTTTYSYDTENRLVQVVTPAGTFTYTYDALGNRISQDHDGVVTSWLHDPIGLVDVAAEYDNGGALVARYIHGDGLTSKEDPSGDRFFYGFEAIGSTGLVTDDAGAVANTYVHDPFGAVRTSAESTQNPYQFVGGEGVRADETSLDFMRARMYDTGTGRFTSEDPIGIVADVNLYRYAANDPILKIDPAGRQLGKPTNPPKKPIDPSPDQEVCPCDRMFANGELSDEEHFKCLLKCEPPPPKPKRESKTQCTLAAAMGGMLEATRSTGTGCEDHDHDPYEEWWSGDPNEKVGPAGHGVARYLNAAGRLSYVVFFENLATYQVPAEEIVITDDLDPDLDASTLELGEVAFGSQLVNSLNGLASGTVTVPLNNSSHLVEITVTNSGAGHIEWRLKTIDPLTGMLPGGVNDGLLPPNDENGRGEGHVSFTVRPLPNLTTGRELRNSATIVFDTNAPITTNEWVNTVDNGKPDSAVTEVTVPEGGAPNLRTVSWAGSDDPGGAGVNDYSLFVSVDGGPYSAMALNTTATTLDFTVQCGRSYGFHTTSRDVLGNAEVEPAGADVTYTAGADIDGDDVCDDGDNCPTIANPSQEDSNGDTIGDACEEGAPTFYVSSDPSDDPDFGTIQAAVNPRTPVGSTIVIKPGNGYMGTVVVDLNRQFTFVGSCEGDVVVDGVYGPAFEFRSTAGTAAMVLEGLTITGPAGVLSSVPVDIRRVRFQSIPGTAVETTSAAHLVNVVMTGGGRGVLLNGTGSLQIEYATLTGNTGAGVQRAGTGAATVTTSIVYGNAGGDLVNVPCASVSWSDVGNPDCSGVNNNLNAPPMFGAGQRLAPGSPCIDRGPSPGTYTGNPLQDMACDLRLRDYDGDGLAVSDLGAYEGSNTSLTPGEVTGLLWTTPTTLVWDGLSGAVEYHIYRRASPFSYAGFGACQDALDADRTDTTLIDTGVPPVGVAWSYLMTGEDTQGSESTLGFSPGAERSNFNPCP